MEYTKIKLLRILDILKESDEDHPCTAKQIIDRLSMDGLEAERKSVLRDVAALQEYGYDIILHPDNKRGWYMASREFEDWELKILMDAAVSANFLTEDNSRQLSDKIAALASRSGQKILRTVTPVSSAVKNGDPTTKNAIDILLKAIKKNRKVGFQYVYPGADLEKHPKFDGHTYPVSPYALIWRQDRYFLIGNYGSHKKLSYYRLERIRNIEILDEPAADLETLLGKNPEIRLREFIDRNLNNYSGKTTFIKLRVDEDRAGLIEDTFGVGGVRLEKHDGDKLVVRATVNDGWGLTQWLLQHGDCVEILEPESVRSEVSAELESIRKKYSAE